MRARVGLSSHALILRVVQPPGQRQLLACARCDYSVPWPSTGHPSVSPLPFPSSSLHLMSAHEPHTTNPMWFVLQPLLSRANGDAGSAGRGHFEFGRCSRETGPPSLSPSTPRNLQWVLLQSGFAACRMAEHLPANSPDSVSTIGRCCPLWPRLGLVPAGPF